MDRNCTIFSLFPWLCCFLLLSLFPACGGKPRVAPISTVPDTTDASGQTGSGLGTTPLIRVLLAEDFDEVQVEGSQRWPALLVRFKNNVFRVISNGAGGSIQEESTELTLTPRSGDLLSVNGSSYRGNLEFLIAPDGTSLLVNAVAIEDYLRSVVPQELGPIAFPFLEALRAQAVAARTYGIVSLGRFAKRGFDVYGDARSQVYRGVETEQPLSNEAIESTSGEALLYGGQPIWALYSSTCGGTTERFENIFRGDPIPYLMGGASCRDEHSPYHQWSKELPASAVENALRRWGQIGGLTELIPRRYSRAGRLIELEFGGPEGRILLQGNDLRSALGVRSNMITDLAVERDARGRVLNIRVQGKGWGHGVGMCQMGAVELAQRGKTYAEILRHYYRGVDLKKLY